MAPSAALSWCRTGWILAPQESEPIQWKKPVLPLRTVAERSFLKLRGEMKSIEEGEGHSEIGNRKGRLGEVALPRGTFSSTQSYLGGSLFDAEYEKLLRKMSHFHKHFSSDFSSIW